MVTERKRASEPLRRSESYLAEGQRLSHTGSFGWEVSTGELYWSDETFRIFGYDRNTKPTVTMVLQRTHPEDRDFIQQTLDHAVKEKSDFDLEHRLLMPEGSVKILHVVARASKDKTGNLEFVGAVTDITARKSTEEALRRSETYLAEAQRMTHTGSWAWHVPSRQTRYWSAEMFRIYGLEPGDKPPPFDFIVQSVHPDDQQSFALMVEGAIQNGREFETDYRILLKDDSVKHIHALARPVFDAAGRLVEYVGTVMDATERTLYEESLLRTKAYLAEAQKLSHTGSWAWNARTGETEYWSEETFRLLGYNPADGIPPFKTFMEGYHPKDRVKVEKLLNGAMAAGQEIEVDYRRIRPDGKIRYMRGVGHPIFDAQGNLAEYVGTVIDLTERKLQEESLNRSRAYIAEAQKLSHTGSFGWDIASGEIYWSDETFRIFEVDPATPVTLDIIVQRTHPEDRTLVQQTIDRAARERADFDFEHRLQMPGSAIKYVHVVARAYEGILDQLSFVGAVIDITPRKHNEDALRRSEAYLAEAQRISHTGSWAWAAETQDIQYWSEETYHLLGFDPAEGLPSMEALFARIHPDDQARVLKLLQTEMGGKRDYTLDYRIVLPHGQVRNIHVVGHPSFDASGSLSGYVGTVIDITERKRAEAERERLREAQNELAHVNRITTMGELTASLAHEIKQPIAAAVTDASTCLRWLKRDAPDIAEAQEAASRAMKDARRAGAIIDRIRLLFRKEPSERALVDINKVIREMIVLLRSEAARYSIAISAELTDGLPPILAERVQLQQVFMNLILNGIDAMKENSKPGRLTIVSQMDSDSMILISCSDIGVGLPAERPENIFDAFFTTKSDGTGMGLAISRSIIESHGGRLWATGNNGQGATFHFTLPTADKGAQ